MKGNRHTYQLSDGQTVTAQDVADQVGVTVSAARLRLKRSLEPCVVFADPQKTTDFSQDAQVFRLSNGLEFTVRQLRELTGIKENTLRQRLKVSTDYDYVTRPLVFEDLDAKVYVFSDGSETTVREFANGRGCSHAAAYDLLESMELETRRMRKRYPLDDGRSVTVEEVAAQTGVSHRTAKKRVQTSTDPRYVLAPIGTRHEKKYLLTDGSEVTAQEVVAATGVAFEVAKQRLQKSRDRAQVFKPHYSRSKRLVRITQHIETEHGLEKVVKTVRACEAFRR